MKQQRVREVERNRRDHLQQQWPGTWIKYNFLVKIRMALGAMAEDNEDPDFTKSVTEALRLRSDYLKGQADHLTLPAVRRLLERDLGLKTSELDGHKALIKNLVDKVLNGEDTTDVIEKPRKRRKNARVVDDDGETEEEKSHVKRSEKKRRLSDDIQKSATTVDEKLPKDVDVPRSSDKEAHGNGSTHGEVKQAVDEEIVEKQEEEPQSDANVSEDSIKEALMKRADELKAQAASLTVNHVKRLLAEDLRLESRKLDSHKLFIRNLVYELLESTSGKAPKVSGENGEADEEEKPKKLAKGKSKKKSVSSDEHDEAGSTGSDSEGAKKGNVLKKKSKSGKRKAEKEVKKAPEPKKSFSPEVERLRALCKTLEIGIPPTAYSKAKNASEDERDEVLIKELENVLGKVGCPPNPTPQDLKRVKAQLKKKRDLEGIDTTNIVSEPRRSRASANSWFTPKPTNKYLQEEKKSGKTSETGDSDGDEKPKITGPMED
ncbi:hypothetical protein R1flu_006949 [Riccia fluitans]|uniref:Histone chaperone domain-containing protein n=1 Tax=Riccia fluitans TaxID=41844 RepID=A0ABD1YYB5_9MARC